MPQRDKILDAATKQELRRQNGSMEDDAEFEITMIDYEMIFRLFGLKYRVVYDFSM